MKIEVGYQTGFFYLVGKFNALSNTSRHERLIALEKFLSFIWTTLTYIIYPPLCPVCKEIVEERGELCQSCREKIYRLDAENFLQGILRGIFIITKYKEGTRDILRKMKFEKDLSVLPTIKKILDAVSNNAELNKFIAQADVATCVPLHQERFKERSFNQTERIFADFLREKNLPIEDLLQRHRSTPRLFKYNPAERQKILQGAFSIVEGANIQGKKILLVDDIYTTGATVTECAKVLKSCGATEIFVLAFASNNDLQSVFQSTVRN